MPVSATCCADPPSHKYASATTIRGPTSIWLRYRYGCSQRRTRRRVHDRTWGGCCDGRLCSANKQRPGSKMEETAERMFVRGCLLSRYGSRRPRRSRSCNILSGDAVEKDGVEMVGITKGDRMCASSMHVCRYIVAEDRVHASDRGIVGLC